jgi:hypothetical protein
MNGAAPLWVATLGGPVLVESLSVEVLGRPVPSAEEIVTCVDEAAADATLEGVGPAQSASNQLDRFRKEVVRAGDLLDAGNERRGCDLLTDAALQIDGGSSPRDLVAGQAAPEIFELLEGLRLHLSCDAVVWNFSGEVEVASGARSPFAIGQVWDGRLAFEPSTPDLQESVNGVGSYPEAIVEVRLSHQKTEIALLPRDREGTAIGVSTQPRDVYDRLGIGLTDVPGELIDASGASEPFRAYVLSSFVDRDATVFDDDRLPLTPPLVEDLEVAGFDVELYFGSRRVRAVLRVRSLSLGKRF